VDVAYGGNFYAIVDPQPAFSDIADVSAGDLLRWSPLLRAALNEKYSFEHPEQPDIKGLSHILWTGKPTLKERDGAQCRVLRRQGDRSIALRHRNIGPYGAMGGQGQAEAG
jgi:4-hydroxyproline epimerase